MNNRKKLQKISIALLVLLVSVFALYWLGDFPSLTAEMAFRRKEKAQLIGPAQIVETKDFEHSRYDHMMIGKSDYGYTFFEWSDGEWDDGVLTYQPKAEDITLFCPKYTYSNFSHEEEWLPIFAFTEHAGTHATLTFEIITDETPHIITLESDRNTYGYFLFSLPKQELWALEYWLVQQLITGEYSNYIFDGTIIATAELFDLQGTLLESFTISQ